MPTVNAAGPGGTVPGMVYILGAGPGDPDLITVRGRRLVQQADVVIYDRLASPELLSLAPAGAELLYAGKQAGSHPRPQAEINRLLAERARAGKTVVRLKGGDPFVFGRGGEEARYLADQAIPFEIVPGISSALAAPACAGIPLTHRGCASSFAVVTGHEMPGKQASDINWQALARGPDTLVFMMGVANLPDIVGKLVAHGRRADTPAALVRSGSCPDQEVITGTLADIAASARLIGLAPPAVLVVGEVVRLRQYLGWLERKPLWGRRVVITRPRRQAGELAGRIRDLGGRPLIFPTVEIIREPDLSGLHAALDELAAFSWIIFSSANAVEIFFDELAGRHADARVLAGVRVCAIGPGTARALRQQGITADLVPHSFCAEGILEELSPRLAPGARVLLPRAGNARDLLERDLPAAVTEVCLYRAHVPACVDEELLAHICRGDAEVVTFTSSSTVSNFVELIGADNLDALASRAAIACIGPVTARTARACGLRVDIEAEAYTVEGLIAAIVSWVGTQRTAAQDS